MPLWGRRPRSGTGGPCSSSSSWPGRDARARRDSSPPSPPFPPCPLFTGLKPRDRDVHEELAVGAARDTLRSSVVPEPVLVRRHGRVVVPPRGAVHRRPSHDGESVCPLPTRAP